MAFLRQCLLILLTLVLGCEISAAANGAKERRAYAAAVSAFQDGMWSRAETEFAQFVQKYPQSTNAPQAVLLQAQAEFKQGKLPQVVSLLAEREAQAGNLADEYVYWIGEAQFQNGDFGSAAETFDSLAQHFPESPLRLRAAVETASARAEMGEWPQVEMLLQETKGVFQRESQVDSGNELVSRGWLLLAQAKFAQNNYGGAAAVLESLHARTLTPELDWQRVYLLCQVKLASGDREAALAATTNLLQIARLENDDDLRAKSLALRADVLEKLGRDDEAIAAYQENLTNSAPVERQRQAVLKIAELAIAQNQFSDAEQALEKFLKQFPDSPTADIVLFTLGELRLKEYIAQPAATNQLQQASATFDRFLGTFTNSLLAGRAYLDRGWCDWLAGKIPESLDFFKAAAQRLPPSEDQAAARFKMGDAMFALTNYTGALKNYRAVLDDFTNFPTIEKTLGAPALYQSLRADLKLNDLNAASNTLQEILKIYPMGSLADSSTLLLGEGLADSQPSAARALFLKSEEQFAHSPLRPQLELAVARTYEREEKWTNAIAEYENWLKNFPTNSLQPQANYTLACVNFQAGNETNAFMLFTNFVARFPTDGLAPLAQWWVADHFYDLGDFVNAERNYKAIFQNTNWQSSPLAFQAQMMAGRAAMGRLGYSDAVGYFSTLAGNTNCPPDLGVQARFAWGGALMRMDSMDTNNPLANFQLATNVFGQIVQSDPTNEWGALAWGEIGDCDLQLSSYDGATNAYTQVINSPAANVAARSQAKIGFGLALEKKAMALTGPDQNALLQLAMKNYLDVLYGNGEMEQDAFWVKKAGLQAADLSEKLGDWRTAANVYSRLEKLLPQLKDLLENKIAIANEHLSSEKK